MERMGASEEVGARSEGIAERTIAEPKGARGGSCGSGLGGGKEGGAQVMLPSGSKSKPLCRYGETEAPRSARYDLGVSLAREASIVSMSTAKKRSPLVPSDASPKPLLGATSSSNQPGYRYVARPRPPSLPSAKKPRSATGAPLR